MLFHLPPSILREERLRHVLVEGLLDLLISSLFELTQALIQRRLGQQQATHHQPEMAYITA